MPFLNSFNCIPECLCNILSKLQVRNPTSALFKVVEVLCRCTDFLCNPVPSAISRSQTRKQNRRLHFYRVAGGKGIRPDSGEGRRQPSSQGILYRSNRRMFFGSNSTQCSFRSHRIYRISSIFCIEIRDAIASFPCIRHSCFEGASGAVLSCSLVDCLINVWSQVYTDLLFILVVSSLTSGAIACAVMLVFPRSSR